MVTKGLLLEDAQGREYLLMISGRVSGLAHAVYLKKRVDGKWVDVDNSAKQFGDLREESMAALLEFFAGICQFIDERSAENERGGSS